mgnify:CR=1 FL=1
MRPVRQSVRAPIRAIAAGVLLAAALNAPSAGIARDKKVEDAAVKAARDFDKNPYPSTYKPYPSAPTALLHATVFDGAGARIDNGTVLPWLRSSRQPPISRPNTSPSR